MLYGPHGFTLRLTLQLIWCLLQWRDTESAAVEYSHVMHCHDNAHQSSVAEIVAKSARSDAACTCADVDTLSAFGRRFLSPARTASHAAGYQEAADAVSGYYLCCKDLCTYRLKCCKNLQKFAKQSPTKWVGHHAIYCSFCMRDVTFMPLHMA